MESYTQVKISPLPREIDSTDIEIILLISRGHSSSYSIRSAMIKDRESSTKNRENKKVMSYINLNKKVNELSRMDLLEEIKPDLSTINTSGRFRRDYKVTVKGLALLIPDVISEGPESVQALDEYMDKFGIDKEAFRKILLKKTYHILSFIESLQEFEKIKKAQQHQKKARKPKLTTIRVTDSVPVTDSVDWVKDSVEAIESTLLLTSSSKPTTRKKS